MSRSKYYELDPEKLLVTVKHLWQRIVERFPESSLAGVCAELVEICKNAQERSEWIGRPIWRLRIAVFAVVAILIALSVTPFFFLKPLDTGNLDQAAFVSTLEAALNDIILITAAIFFLFTIEARVKRRRALAALRELRAVAHVIDMHQLTKDPDRILRKEGENTVTSPKTNLTPFQLRRYLDYCSEMLSLTGKIASLYLNRTDDQAAVAAVNEIEDLTTGLSRKIWQKIMISQSLSEGQKSGVSS
ncbi:MAG: hypothetical protein AAGA58_10225 [Verrucomicrobiota bacterium]